MNCNECKHIGYSGNRQFCGLIYIATGETVYIKQGKISGSCPLHKIVDTFKPKLIKDAWSVPCLICGQPKHSCWCQFG